MSIGNDPVGKQPTLDEVLEIENHIHNFEKWFGLAGTPAAETHRADRMDGVIAAFTLTAGDNDFGDWLQVLGSSDTPIKVGKTKFNLHRIMVVTTNSTRPFIVHVVTGESAGIAAKLIAEDFNEFPYIAATNSIETGITELIDKRIDVGEKVWMRCADVGGNGTTLELYIGIHEYDR